MPSELEIEIQHRLVEAMAESARLALELRESQRRVNTLLDAGSEFMFLLTPAGVVQAVNAVGARRFDLQPADMVGRSIFDYLPPDLAEVRRVRLAEVAASGEPVHCPDNHGETSFENTLVPVKDEAGRVESIAAFVKDVTERRRAEQALQEARLYAENLIQTANIMFVELDLAGNLRNLNRAAEKITGYALEELRGRSWFETIVPRERYPYVWREFERIVAADESADEFENPILTRSGEERQIHWRNSRIVQHGEVVGTLSFGIDVTANRRMQARLAQSEALLLEAQGIAQVGSWSYDLARDGLSWSDQIFRILELDPTRTHASTQAILDALHPAAHEHFRAIARQLTDTIRPYEITLQLHLRDDSIKHVHLRSKTLFGLDGKPFRIVGTLQDVTFQTLQEMALKESEERFRTIADYTYDWEYWIGVNRELLYASPSCARITGYPAVDFVRDPTLFDRIVHPEDRELFAAHQRDVGDQPQGDLVFRIVTRDGQVRWVAHGCRAVFSRDGTPHGRRASNRDITDLKQAEQLAHRLAHFDSLTNLPNRRLLMDRLLHAIAQGTRFRRALAVMFLDLDRFKQVNDSLGHDVGDKLLVEIATRLTACVRQGDTVSRTGGDEFIIVLPEIAQPSDASTVAEKILEAVGGPVNLGAHAVDTSVSIGIAVRPEDGTDNANELMMKADRAMYAAKQAGRNCYRLFG